MNEKRKANGDKCLWTGKNEQQHEQQVQVSNGNNNNNRLSVSQADSDRVRERASAGERTRCGKERKWRERERASPTSQADRAKPSQQRLLISVCVQSTFWPKRVCLASAHEPSVGLPSSRITPPLLSCSLSASLSVLSVRVRVCVSVSVNKMWLAKIQKKQTQRWQKNRKDSVKVC